MRRGLPLPIGASIVLAALLCGCGSTGHLAVSHRHSPEAEARIVVTPIVIPAGAAVRPNEGKTLATLYATELLKSYEILEYERFERSLQKRNLTLDNILVDGATDDLVQDLGIDAVLLSEVYDWERGKPGILFLAKKGRVGFQARLIDVRTGSVIWSVNRVMATAPGDPLSVGLGTLFQELAAEMPRNLTPY
jgi:hypothetical protein